MSTPPKAPSENEHEVLTYLRVGKNINKSGKYKPMKMKKNTPLANALDDMSCIPFIQTPLPLSDMKFTVDGVDAGMLQNPNVDVILEKSTPSSFGRGSETVLDPSYRSGLEIPADKIEIECYNNSFQDTLLDAVKDFMFLGRDVSIKLYKLAIYENGGHFDWHMDSTHSDKHHATLLLGLNTSWEGGNLMFRRKGMEETAVDLRSHKEDGWVDLQVVAFYTDTEHRVEPVKSGTRIVLQYDIEVEKEVEKKDTNGFPGEPWMRKIQQQYSERKKIKIVGQAVTDQASLKLENLISIIKKLHSNGTEEVAFGLQHLYRMASILPEYLKGSDAIIYNGLLATGEFDISLRPVIFFESSEGGDEGEMTVHNVYCYSPAAVKEEDDDEEDSEEEDDLPPSKKQKKNVVFFHIPEVSGIVEISSQGYVEYTGNESMDAKYRYFGGGMFVRPKDK